MSAHQSKREHLREVYNKIDGILHANAAPDTGKIRQEFMGLIKEERRDAVEKYRESQEPRSKLWSDALAMPNYEDIRRRE